MPAQSNWEDLTAGKDCPFCAPRGERNEFSLLVKKLSASTLYLDREQTYLGRCALIYSKRHVTGLELLTDAEYGEFMGDLRIAMKAIAAAVAPDQMNYASLGNSIPHLHYHIIPRYKTNPRWRVNPFADTPPVRFDTEAEYDALADKIRPGL
ncbi:MAG: HIT family protein [Alphaproteobacteria bacterium]